MTIKPLCPYCGNTLEYDELRDEYYTDESVMAKYRGGCRACEKTFDWWERYAFEKIMDIEEVSDD